MFIVVGLILTFDYEEAFEKEQNVSDSLSVPNLALFFYLLFRCRKIVKICAPYLYKTYFFLSSLKCWFRSLGANLKNPFDIAHSCNFSNGQILQWAVKLNDIII